MEIGAILVLLALLIGIGLFLAAPIMNRRTRRTAATSQESSSLMAERDRVITSLQELDFDFKLGKIPEGDYPAQRAELLQRGSDVLKKLDSLKAASSSDAEAEARLEKAVVVRGADSAAGSPKSVSDDELESMLAARRKALGSKVKARPQKAAANTESVSDDEIESMLAARRNALGSKTKARPQKVVADSESVSDDEIESMLAARRKALAPKAKARPQKAVAAVKSIDSNDAGQESVSDDELESMLAARRKGRGAKSAGFCPRCGKPILTTDHFCPNCGKAIN